VRPEARQNEPFPPPRDDPHHGRLAFNRHSYRHMRRKAELSDPLTLARLGSSAHPFSRCSESSRTVVRSEVPNQISATPHILDNHQQFLPHLCLLCLQRGGAELYPRRVEFPEAQAFSSTKSRSAFPLTLFSSTPNCECLYSSTNFSQAVRCYTILPNYIHTRAHDIDVKSFQLFPVISE
jgi:hypothetical protein